MSKLTGERGNQLFESVKQLKNSLNKNEIERIVENTQKELEDILGGAKFAAGGKDIEILEKLDVILDKKDVEKKMNAATQKTHEHNKHIIRTIMEVANQANKRKELPQGHISEKTKTTGYNYTHYHLQEDVNITTKDTQKAKNIETFTLKEITARNTDNKKIDGKIKIGINKKRQDTTENLKTGHINYPLYWIDDNGKETLFAHITPGKSDIKITIADHEILKKNKIKELNMPISPHIPIDNSYITKQKKRNIQLDYKYEKEDDNNEDQETTNNITNMWNTILILLEQNNLLINQNKQLINIVKNIHQGNVVNNINNHAGDINIFINNTNNQTIINLWLNIIHILNITIPESTPTPRPRKEKVFLDAHLMDKKLLVKKSVHQDILQKTQEKYAKAGFLKKFGMFMVNRPLQAIREKNTMNQLINDNEFIESDNTLQSRVAGSIGTFAEEAKMGLSEESVELDRGISDDHINQISSDYILRKITKSQAIKRLNAAFKNNPNLSIGEMTGTDIIEQLDAQGGDYALRYHMRTELNASTSPINYIATKELLKKFFVKFPDIKIAGYPIDKNNVDALPNSVINDIRDDIIGLASEGALHDMEINVNLIGVHKKYGAELGETETETNRKDTIGKFFSNGTGGAIPYGMAAARAARALTYGTLTASGVGLPLALAGAIGTSGIIQYFKTYHDTLKESQNIHEKAIHMGPEELQRHLNQIQREIDKCSKLNKTLGRAFGRGKHRRLVKQQALYQSVNDNINQLDHNDKQYILKKSSDIIDGLRRNDADTIIDLLARIRAGKDHGTNFISGSSRELNEVERKEIMTELRRAGSTLPGAPAADASPEVWNSFWTNLTTNTNHRRLYDEVYDDLARAHLNLTHDVDKNRHSKGTGDARRVMAASAAIAGTAAAVSGIVNGSRSSVTTQDTLKDVRTLEGDHVQYAPGRYTGGTTIHGNGRETGIANNAHITIDGEAAVDALVTKAGSYPASAVTTEHATLTSDIASSGFNKITKDALQDAIDGEMTKLAAEATRVGADPGNVNLVQHRWMKMAKKLMDDLSLAGKTGVTIDKINFDPTEFADATGNHAININSSVAGSTGDIVDRSTAFNVYIKELVPGDTTTGARYTRRPGDPRRVFWPGFANTYARPERRQQQSRTSQHKNKMSEKRRNKFLQWRNKEKNRTKEGNERITQQHRRKYKNRIIKEIEKNPDPKIRNKYSYGLGSTHDDKKFITMIDDLQKNYISTLSESEKDKLDNNDILKQKGKDDDYQIIYNHIQNILWNK